MERGQSSVSVSATAARLMSEPHLDVHVQSVVKVTKPEEVGKSQRDVKGAQLFVPQRKQPQNIQVVLIPPVRYKSSRSEKRTMLHSKAPRRTQTKHIPANLLIARRKVTVDKPKRSAIEHE